jgi:hypothetical protein
MNPVHPLGRVLATLAVLSCAVLAMAAARPAAFAMTIVPDPGGGTAPVTRGGVRVLAGGGMPGWQITVIAAGAALAAAVAAVLVDRARSTRRTPAAASA